MEMTLGAAKKLSSFATPEKAIRLAIQGGGCAGFEYKFGEIPVEDITEDDFVIEKSNAKVYVDVISANYLQGVIIDWIEDTFGSHFKIKNPNAKTTCGCGSSFS
tara:strand:- start:569 stop:880 length:312 start_codon:yes stop_codon:yes gene_type:complete